VWFRVNNGILEESGAENGAYSWPAPKGKPNARVSRYCLPFEFYPGPLKDGEKYQLTRAAIESLLSNIKAQG
jgi:hypothetical protein